MKFANITKGGALNALFCLIWLFFLNAAAILIFPAIPTWPMFFVTIFMNLYGVTPSSIKKVFISGMTGTFISFAFSYCFPWAISILGETPGYALTLIALLAVILYGQLFFPGVLNSVCFGYLSLYFISSGTLARPIGLVALIGMEIIGGSLALAGLIAADKLSRKLLPEKITQPAASAGNQEDE